jgi:hypothetical protein
VQRQYTGCSASTPVLPGASRTARLPSTSPIPVGAGTRRSTGNCMCRARGSRMRPAAGWLGFPRRSAAPRSPRSPSV